MDGSVWPNPNPIVKTKSSITIITLMGTIPAPARVRFPPSARLGERLCGLRDDACILAQKIFMRTEISAQNALPTGIDLGDAALHHY